MDTIWTPESVAQGVVSEIHAPVEQGDCVFDMILAFSAGLP